MSRCVVPSSGKMVQIDFASTKHNTTSIHWGGEGGGDFRTTVAIAT